MTALTERQLREKNYYAQYALNFDVHHHIDFSPVEGPFFEKERRPWNSYWRVYEIPVDHIRSNNSHTPLQLLDFGCGPGDNALRFSRVGYDITGFDICEENIKTCQKLFSLNNCESQGRFLVSPAETLEFQNESFDVVIGIDILHHVDIPMAMNEVRRVLKTDGIAIFREPIEVPLLDFLRNTRLVRFFFPNAPSLEAHITQDERKLNDQDLRLIKKIFPKTRIERSLVLARLDKFFRKSHDTNPSLLEKCDHMITKLFPAWGKLGGAAVLVIKK